LAPPKRQAYSKPSLISTLYSAKAVMVPHRVIWSCYTGRWLVGSYIWYSEEGTGRSCSPPTPLLSVPNVSSSPINGQCTNHRIAV